MRLDLRTNHQPLLSKFTVVPIQKGKQRIRIVSYDPQYPLTRYTDRYVELEKERDFQVRIPQTPKNIVIQITSEHTKAGQPDRSLKLTNVKIERLEPCPIVLDSQARSFIRFAQDFCEVASYVKPGNYPSPTKQYLIQYLPTIIDRKSGKQLNTPARIGHESGRIEVARDKFMKYSVAMQMVILLHEFSHKYMNHKIGKDIDDEVAADISALYMYLGLGYSHIDARLVFSYVFYGKDTPLNKQRLNVIEEYITAWENGQIMKGCQ